MAETVHLIVDQGPSKGQKLTVPADGARVGRSSKNDIVIEDPLLSRHHCRLFFKPGDGLWVTDLGSANGTLVKGSPITEVPIRVGDTVTIGDTVLKVLSDSVGAGSADAGNKEKKPQEAAKAISPVVDLGLKSEKEKVEILQKKSPVGFLIAGAVLAIVVAMVIWMPKLLKGGKTVKPLPPPAAAQNLELEYEKVIANTGNVFRYTLTITTNDVISVQIDDIKNDRHVRKEKPMSSEYTKSLAKSIIDAGFFSLQDEYQGVQPDMLEQWDLSITIGKQTHRTRVINRIEPESFSAIREKIEQAGKNELDLFAMETSPEKLTQLSRDAHLMGKKCYDEREIKYGNLALALKNFKEAETYLETIEPKPDFYAENLAMITDCKRLLEDKYNDQSFRVEQARRRGDWDEAAKELRILLEMIPDGGDQRNKDARKKLLDVEKHLEKKR